MRVVSPSEAYSSGLSSLSPSLPSRSESLFAFMPDTARHCTTRISFASAASQQPAYTPFIGDSPIRIFFRRSVTTTMSFIPSRCMQPSPLMSYVDESFCCTLCRCRAAFNSKDAAIFSVKGLHCCCRLIAWVWSHVGVRCDHNSGKKEGEVRCQKATSLYAFGVQGSWSSHELFVSDVMTRPLCTY